MKPKQPETPDGGKGAVRPERPKGHFSGSRDAHDDEKLLSGTRYCIIRASANRATTWASGMA